MPVTGQERSRVSHQESLGRAQKPPLGDDSSTHDASGVPKSYSRREPPMYTESLLDRSDGRFRRSISRRSEMKTVFFLGMILAATASAQETVAFGPMQFTRSAGPPNTF